MELLYESLFWIAFGGVISFIVWMVIVAVQDHGSVR